MSSPETIAFIAAASIFGAALPRAVYDLRRGPQSLEPAPWWPFGIVAWRAYERATPTLALTGLFFAVPLLGLGAFPGLEGTATDSIESALTVLLIVGLVLAGVVGFSGRPRRLVPAKLRDFE